MPLMQGKSKSAFSHNIQSEIGSGKPKNQAVAIAEAIKRKKMAMGGAVEEPDEDFLTAKMATEPELEEHYPDPDLKESPELESHDRKKRLMAALDKVRLRHYHGE